MTPETAPEDRYRDTFQEYEVGEERVALISDPDNDDAWIRSTVHERLIP